jgi:soluble cytochrome b562
MRFIWCHFYKLSFTFVFGALLIGCQQPETTQTENFENELQSFNQKMDNLGESMDLMDAMQQEIDEIEREANRGEISDAEAGRRVNQVKNTYGRALARRSNINPATALPDWARSLGLTEPRGMTLDLDYSQTTSALNPEEGFNSVLLVYTANYNHAMAEAKRIAELARIPMSKDYEQAVELARTYSSAPIRGVAYMNFDPFVSDQDYNISITVDDDGMLTISVVDVEQMRLQFERESADGIGLPLD